MRFQLITVLLAFFLQFAKTNAGPAEEFLYVFNTFSQVKKGKLSGSKLFLTKRNSLSYDAYSLDLFKAMLNVTHPKSLTSSMTAAIKTLTSADMSDADKLAKDFFTKYNCTIAFESNQILYQNVKTWRGAMETIGAEFPMIVSSVGGKDADKIKFAKKFLNLTENILEDKYQKFKSLITKYKISESQVISAGLNYSDTKRYIMYNGDHSKPAALKADISSLNKVAKATVFTPKLVNDVQAAYELHDRIAELLDTSSS